MILFEMVAVISSMAGLAISTMEAQAEAKAEANSRKEVCNQSEIRSEDESGRRRCSSKYWPQPIHLAALCY